jgi:hypothetical protein
MKSGLSIRQATDRLQIHHWYYARWKKTMQTADNLIKNDEVTSRSFIWVDKAH